MINFTDDFAGLIPDSFFNDVDRMVLDEMENNLSQTVGMDDMPEDIFNILLNHCLQTGKIRDGLLITLHANFGMRYSDVCQLRGVELIVPQTRKFRERVVFVEKKTNKTRVFYINKAVKLAVSVFLNKNPKKNLADYLITSESNNRRYEVETYLDEKGREKKIRRNGKIVYKLDENGNKIPLPLSHTQEESIIKDTLAEMGILLKNDGSYKGGEVKYNTHSLRKLYAEKYSQVAMELSGEKEKDEDKKIDLNPMIIQWVQMNLGHKYLETTIRYCKINEKNDRIICNNMNLGFEVWKNYAIQNNLI